MDNLFKNGGGFKYLVPGTRYVVTREFVDYDRRVHPVGERWTFLKASFVPYYDGLTLEVQPESGGAWRVRMEWLASGQGEIIDHLEQYVVADVS